MACGQINVLLKRDQHVSRAFFFSGGISRPGRSHTSKYVNAQRRKYLIGRLSQNRDVRHTQKKCTEKTYEKKKKGEEEEWILWAYRKNKQEINPWIWYLWHVPSCARRITNSFAFPLSLFLFILLKEYSEEVGKKLDWPSFALLYFNGEWNWPLNRIWWGLSDDEISKRQIEKNVCRNVSECSVFAFFVVLSASIWNPQILWTLTFSPNVWA